MTGRSVKRYKVTNFISIFVSDIQIISNLWFLLLAEIFFINCEQINFKFQWQTEKTLIELCLGPGLSSASPPNNSKTLCNHVAIHIFVTIKKKEPVSFWSHYTCYVLLPGTLFEIIQTRNHCYQKIIVIMTSQRQITIF